MTKSWDSYYVVFLSGVLSLGIPFCLSLISLIFFPRKKAAAGASAAGAKATVLLNRPRPHQSINVRFFLAANAALVLMALALELVPCVVTLQSSDPSLVLKGMVAVITLASFSALGLIYATKKGNMNWLPSSHVAPDHLVSDQLDLENLASPKKTEEE